MGLSKTLKKIGIIASTVGPAIVVAGDELKKGKKSGTKDKEDKKE